MMQDFTIDAATDSSYLYVYYGALGTTNNPILEHFTAP